MTSSRFPSQTAVLGGGCFWCLDAVFRGLEGVASVESGYAGGASADPTYEQVCSGRTGHAEVVRVTFDPAVITFRDLLTVFFTIHDPTTKDRQGNDVGSQYRSAIFYQSEDEKKVAEAYITQLNDAKAFGADKQVMTTLEPYKSFYVAEDYHQNYARLNPNQGYIRAIAAPKVQKVFEHFQDKVKKPGEEPKK